MNVLDLEVSGGRAVVLEVGSGGAVSLGIGRASGTSDYTALANKPSIEGVALVGDRTMPEFGWDVAREHDIDKVFFGEGI